MFRVPSVRVLVLGLFAAFSIAPMAFADVPQCWSNSLNEALSVDNQQVITWKSTTPNEFLSRAFVQGTVNRITMIRPTHIQFELQIGSQQGDTVEIVYDRAFGELPQITPGMQVVACGDYITIKKLSGPGSSPDGAIIHWVHYNPGNQDATHESGFLVIEGVLYGYPSNQR